MADSQQFLKELDKKPWTAADKLRANLDAAVYKHAVLGLIFLKYVSDSFDIRQQQVEMLELFKGRVYNPAMGSGGFFVSSEKFIEEHGGKIGDVSVYGQESNPTTWRLAAMNMAIRGIDFDFQPVNSFTSDAHPDLRANYVIANPPAFVSDKALAVGTSATKPAASALPLTRNDPRWEHGDPPNGNANFGWLQHMLYHRSIHSNTVRAKEGTHHHPDSRPISDATPGVASMALLLANGSMSSNTKGEGEIRAGVVKADLVECMVALPGQLFTNTQIPACIWFLTKTKQKRGRSAAAFRDRPGEVLIIDARKLGDMVDRVPRAFTDEDTAKIVSTFHAWKRGPIVTQPVSDKALAAGLVVVVS